MATNFDAIGDRFDRHSPSDVKTEADQKLNTNEMREVFEAPKILVEDWDQPHCANIPSASDSKDGAGKAKLKREFPNRAEEHLRFGQKLSDTDDNDSIISMEAGGIYAFDDEDFPQIRSNAPIPSFPHLLACAGVEWSEAKTFLVNMVGFSLEDAIVTALYNHSKQTLNTFLDQKNYAVFRFVREASAKEVGSHFNIVRKGSHVLCGFYKPVSATQRHFQWQTLVMFVLPDESRKPWERTFYSASCYTDRVDPSSKVDCVETALAFTPASTHVNLRHSAAKILLEEVWKSVEEMYDVSVSYLKCRP